MTTFSIIIPYLCDSTCSLFILKRVLVEFLGLKKLVSVAVLAMLVVLVAMMVDLASGLYKAKLRGELRTSEGLRRTLMKFITYEGGMLIAVGVDVLLNLSQLAVLFRLESFANIPMVTCLVGIFLLVVEMLSVREKADAKTRKNIDEAAKIAMQLAAKEEVISLIQQAMEKRMNEKDDDNL